MKKSMKIFLGVAGVLALIGLCFACLSIYAKKEINKPRFEFPEVTVQQPAASLPENKESAFDCVSALYGNVSEADDVEGSIHTDVHMTEGEIVSPFSDADNEVLSRVLEKAQENVSALYPVTENVIMNKVKDVPKLSFSKDDVTGFTADKLSHVNNAFLLPMCIRGVIVIR